MRGIARKDSLRDNRFLPMQILAVSTQATQNNQIGMKNNKRLYIQSASGPVDNPFLPVQILREKQDIIVTCVRLHFELLK